MRDRHGFGPREARGVAGPSPRAMLVGCLAAAALLLAGCGSPDHDGGGRGAPGRGTPHSGATGHRTSPAPSDGLQTSPGGGSADAGGGAHGGSSGDGGARPGSTAASGGGAVPASKRCQPRQISARVRPLGAAAGTHHASILVTNDGRRSCQSSGYLGLQLFAKSGAKIPTTIKHDTAKRPRTVTLQPHHSMYALASWGAVADGGESQTGGCETAPHALRVALPGASGSVRTGWSYGPVCEHGAFTLTALAAGGGPAGP